MTTTDAPTTRTTSEASSPARPDVWPLAPLQTGLLYHAVSGDGGLDVYAMQSTYAFAPGTDLDVVKAACRSLLDRHGALRAGFSASLLDRPIQFVPPTVELPWRVVDLTDRPAAEAEAALEAVQVDERQRRFDMDVPPLIRFVALDLGPGGVRLVVTNHHIVLDGWSDALLVVELLRHLAAGGRDESLPPAPQFRDYLAWLTTQDQEMSLEHWRRALSGLESGSLLAESTGPAVLPDVDEVELSAEATRGVTDLARRCSVSTNTVYSTLWGLLLRSLLGRDDVVFGTTVSGRPADLAGVEETIGLFLNTLPQRVRVLPNETVADLVARVQAEQADLVEHHHVGLGDVQQRVGVGPLFDTLYVMRNTPTDDDAFAELSAAVGLTDLDGGDATHYPATFIVHPGERTRLILSYRPDVIDAARARGVLARAGQLIAQMVADPTRPVGSLDPLPADEREALVQSWRGEHRALPDTSLVDLLRTTTARVPDRVALVDDAGATTFAELWTDVLRQAAALREAGVVPGDLVTIEVPRGRGVVVALFAVLAARAAYVPIDLGWPAARQESVRAAAAPAARIIGDAGETRIAAVHARTGRVVAEVPSVVGALGDPRLEDQAFDDSRAFDDSQDLQERALTPGYRHDDLAYVMFTSGSTGAPKGVAIEHTGLVNMLVNHRRRIFEPAGAGEAEPWRVAHAISFAFDMSWEELLWLLDGHEVHLLSDEVRRDPAAMIDHLTRHSIDVINVTPSVASALLADGLLDPATHTPRLVLLGGEAVGPDVWNPLRDAPGTDGYNLYGPTEYTINTLGGGTRDSATPIVGVPVDNTDVRVLDTSLAPVPNGVPGELYITGAGLARGYHGAPALTAERFVADPYGAPGARMYRTGDVVSRRPDGVFDFHGRSDGQVKIRGHRVEPGEVQAVLADDPRVARCAVVPHRSASGSLALVAYAVPAHGATDADLTDPAVLARLRSLLPEAMVPAAIVPVPDLPLTVNSKLDVARLPAPQLTAGTGRAPRGPREEAVAAVFAEVLGVENLGADDNFFALGGHSLLAMRAVGALSTRLGTRVGVATLLAAPTPAGLVDALDGDHDPLAPVLPLGGRAGNGLAPVVCLHPLLGTAWTFSALAARLGAGSRTAPPVYGIQSPALREPDHAPADLDALAADTVDRLTAAAARAGDDIARVGCHLVGWSFGAHLAHAVAACLERQGRRVHSLTLLDPGPPTSDMASTEVEGETREEQIQGVLRFLLAAGLREVPETLTEPYDVDEALDFLTEGSGTFSGIGADDLESFRRARELGLRLLPTARPHPVSAPTTLVLSTTQDPDGSDRDRVEAAWRQVLARVHRVDLDIPHDLLTAPYAAERIAPLVPISGRPDAAATASSTPTPSKETHR